MFAYMYIINRWSPASLTFNNYFYLFIYIYIFLFWLEKKKKNILLINSNQNSIRYKRHRVEMPNKNV